MINYKNTETVPTLETPGHYRVPANEVTVPQVTDLVAAATEAGRSITVYAVKAAKYPSSVDGEVTTRLTYDPRRPNLTAIEVYRDMMFLDTDNPVTGSVPFDFEIEVGYPYPSSEDDE